MAPEHRPPIDWLAVAMFVMIAATVVWLVIGPWAGWGWPP